jgi:hypothetical protein
MHNFPIEPTEETFSFFIVYLSTHIKPDSVNSYLSGICNQLEPFFPDVQQQQASILVSWTLDGCRWHFRTPTHCKQPLSTTNLDTVISHISTSLDHDKKLFLAILLTGFHGLLQFSQLTFPDRIDSHDYCKVTLCHTIKIASTFYSFLLPGHEANCFFEGNTIIIQKTNLLSNPHKFLLSYLTSQDHLHPFKPKLWLCKSGIVPTHSWFIKTSFKPVPPALVTACQGKAPWTPWYTGLILVFIHMFYPSSSRCKLLLHLYT